ncbi:MAG: DUF4860 domain-containing protein [Coriobacteriales bacterium]|jgi:hypothetical protein|nr:DUF4860 domain-containing protein [Coriobacteriales bacterium]
MKRHSLDLVVIIALFFVYATCALFLCVIGAEVYRETAATMQHNYDHRTSALYVAEKVRQNDLEGCVRVDSVDGANALVLIEKRSGRDYETWIFVKDRMLYEGLFAPGAVIDARLCQPIMPMSSLTIKQAETTEGLLSATFYTVDGQVTDVNIWLRTEQDVRQGIAQDNQQNNQQGGAG